MFIPKKQHNFYKFWWSHELDVLKNNAIVGLSSIAGKDAGKPRFGVIFTERFRGYSTFVSPLGAKLWEFGGKMTPQNVKWEKNTCWEGTSLHQTAPFELLCVKLSLSVWPVQMRKKKGRKAGSGMKEEKSQKVYIPRMRGATPSSQIPTKLGKYVCLTNIIKREIFHRYNLRGFGAVRCWSFYFAIGNPGRP